ncbi:tripartite tricarboxylate transporter substrate binding protein [Roseomonas sp. NAR14]|uniref:Tripartite tricarboxylate transporter substrate binding protein n=1 Tax=Roseomonas acroporae TaxID=2937791 RepID=A0A9X1YFN9_9PROT|nr:tripartite tricarboxylate transporter substrate binding protein [Roseomonas acroporae]MCK8785371.1 tripartite tricarboxylate transporter substrate binding protein [Roseomonas acroporae]
MSVLTRRDSLRLAGAAALAAPLVAPLVAPGIARAQGNWPNQPIKLVVPFAAGGPTDIPARLLAEELGKMLPQRVIVDNRTGSGVVVGTEVVAKAPKDGYTFLYTTVAHTVLRAMFARLPFDPDKDFQPVALCGVIPLILMASKELPVNNLQDLIKLYRDNPGKYDYGSSGNGGAMHLAAELFLKQAGDLRVNHVPYRGAAPAMPDLLNGTLSMIMNVANDALPYVQRGQVKGLGISSSHRLPLLPDMPTIAEAVPGYEAYTWHMVMAPAGTPMPIVLAMNEAVNKVMAMDRVKTRLAELTMETRSDTTPETAAKWLRDETAKWDPVVRAAGIVAN